MNNKIIKTKILIVEDDTIMSNLISFNLNKVGFNIKTIKNGNDIINVVMEYAPDIILLDWILPNISGMQICNMLRLNNKTWNIPIIMISAKSGDMDKVLALDNGADDYMTKPFNIEELIARIKALLRRLNRANNNKLICEDIELDLDTCIVLRNNINVELSPTEFQILKLLMQYPNKVFSRRNLIDKIWPHDKEVCERTIDVHITKLRKNLLKASNNKREIIETIRTIGYKLVLSNV
jgi:two-component system phosphate regulon response regulator PhoB